MKPGSTNSGFVSVANVHGRWRDLKAILFFVEQTFLYALSIAGALSDAPLVVNLLFSLFAGLVIGQLFILGHDACHQSLAASQWLNALLARLAFVPALHACSLWNLEHNLKHHGHTNLKGQDPSWPPMTKAEYEASTPLRRWLERVFRGPFGPGLYFMTQMWIRRHLFPLGADAAHLWRKHLPDSVFVSCAYLLQAWVIVNAGTYLAPAKTALAVISLGLVIPFLAWNWIMGLVIYLHHTHPSIPWFDKAPKMSRSTLQLRVTAHVIFPQPLRGLLYSIMEHPAHHLQVNIPLDRLAAAQAQLQNSSSDHLLRYEWDLATYLQIIKACKLYDFDAKCWTDFKGQPTSSVH